MALEVNEIGISMRVDDGDEEDDTGGGRKSKMSDEDDDCGCASRERGEIVDDCVRRVLQALKTMRER
jgi:hypothetical protein